MDPIDPQGNRANFSTVPATTTTPSNVKHDTSTYTNQVAPPSIAAVTAQLSTPPPFDRTAIKLELKGVQRTGSPSPRRTSPSDRINPGSTGNTLLIAVLSPRSEDGTPRTPRSEQR